MARQVKTGTVCYIIDCNATVAHKLRKISDLYDADVRVDYNGEVTITAKEKDLAKIEKLLARYV